MAYKTPTEMVEMIKEERLLTDACSAVIDGHNEFGFRAAEVPACNCRKLREGDGKVTYRVRLSDKEGHPVINDIQVDAGKEFSVWIMDYGHGVRSLFCVYHSETDLPPAEVKRLEYMSVVAHFCEQYGIQTRTRMMGVLEYGFAQLKKEAGIESPCTLLRDYMDAAVGARTADAMPVRPGALFQFHPEAQAPDGGTVRSTGGRVAVLPK